MKIDLGYEHFAFGGLVITLMYGEMVLAFTFINTLVTTADYIIFFVITGCLGISVSLFIVSVDKYLGVSDKK